MTINRPPAIVINNATLRDVEQMVTSPFSRRNQIDLARDIEAVGAGDIELPMPVSGGSAIEELKALAAVPRRARPILWGPASRHIVDAAVRAGLAAVYLSAKLSSKHASRPLGLDRLARVIAYAREQGLRVALCGDDASRADFDLIRRVLALAETAGAFRFRVTDTAGVLHPIRTHALFRQLCAETDLELEFRGHDNFGLATANTVAAVEGGATHISVSMVRRAERTRVAQLEDAVGAICISTLHPVDVDLALVPAVLSRIAALPGMPAAPSRAGASWMPPRGSARPAQASVEGR